MFIFINLQALGLNSGFLFKHISRISLRAGSEARCEGDSWERIMCRGVSMPNSVPEAGPRVILASSIPRDQMSTFLLHSNHERYTKVMILFEFLP